MVNGCRHGGGKVNSNRMDSYTDKFDVSIFLESFYYVSHSRWNSYNGLRNESSSSANRPARAKNGDTILFHVTPPSTSPPKEQIKVLIGERFGVNIFPSPTHLIVVHI
jgi:hypothetical protein